MTVGPFISADCQAVYSSGTFISTTASLQLHFHCTIFSLLVWYPMIISTLHVQHCKMHNFAVEVPSLNMLPSLQYVHSSLIPRPIHSLVFYYTGWWEGVGMEQCSLVPRSLQHLVFDRLQWRGRPGIFYPVNDVSVYLGRQRGEGSLIERTHHFTRAFFISNQ